MKLLNILINYSWIIPLLSNFNLEELHLYDEKKCSTSLMLNDQMRIKIYHSWGRDLVCIIYTSTYHNYITIYNEEVHELIKLCSQDNIEHLLNFI